VDLIERVGAYVGIAAFFGLAILALLYFSQARDVRRLREWAGRAPERAGELAASQHYLPPTPIEQTGERKRKPLRERIGNIYIPHGRYIALGVGALVILAGAAFGAVQVLDNGNDSSSSSANTKPAAKGQRTRSKQREAPSNIQPSQVTVAVLNGTTIAGLAAQVGDVAETAGFTRGVVTNAARTDQSRSEVLYRQGQKAAASLVADRLGIKTIAPVDPLTAELAGSFDVVVLVGSDRANG
jgi:LytR cell envelope-related transcriptional attenuator